MTGAAFFHASLDASPVVGLWPREETASTPSGQTRHVINYHAVTEGRCHVQVSGGDVFELTSGQVAVFPKGDPHVVWRDTRSRLAIAGPAPARFVLAELRYALQLLGDPIPAKLVSGYLACEAGSFIPFIEHLPTILVGDCSEGLGLPALRALTSLAVPAAHEARGTSHAILGRLAELMFIDVVRQYLDGLPGESRSWLSGLRDQSVGRALALMHGHPSRAWSLNGLAREVGLSRSEFAERFTAFVGIPPMQYLARWRMQTAAGLLKNSVNIASVANEVGYSSEASFSRAFKKIVGLSPSHWRGGDLARVA
jgi:AraC-like DNA-binding protein